MTEMLLIVPSRGRPHNIRRLCEGLINTETEADLIIGIDEDDPAKDGYLEVVREYGHNLCVAQERKRFAETVNTIAKYFYKEYKYLAWMGDDHLPRTKHWDKRYADVLEYLKVGVVYGDDLVMGEAIATELAFTSNIVDALGYAIPPGFVHLFVDNYFMELGKSINALKYLPDVVVEHLHPTVGNAQEDQTYREANSPENWTNDERRFREYVANELPKDTEKLASLF